MVGSPNTRVLNGNEAMINQDGASAPAPTGWVFSEGISGLTAFCTPLCGEYWKAKGAPILSLTLTLQLCTMSAWTSVRSADNVRILY